MNPQPDVLYALETLRLIEEGVLAIPSTKTLPAENVQRAIDNAVRLYCAMITAQEFARGLSEVEGALRMTPQPG